MQKVRARKEGEGSETGELVFVLYLIIAQRAQPSLAQTDCAAQLAFSWACAHCVAYHTSSAVQPVGFPATGRANRLDKGHHDDRCASSRDFQGPAQLGRTSVHGRSRRVGHNWASRKNLAGGRNTMSYKFWCLWLSRNVCRK